MNDTYRKEIIEAALKAAAERAAVLVIANREAAAARNRAGYAKRTGAK